MGITVLSVVGLIVSFVYFRRPGGRLKERSTPMPDNWNTGWLLYSGVGAVATSVGFGLFPFLVGGPAAPGAALLLAPIGATTGLFIGGGLFVVATCQR